jgi:cytochrome P450
VRGSAAPFDQTGSRARDLVDLPGPRGVPLLGNVLQLHPKRLHRILSRWEQEFGRMYVFRIARQPILVLADAELIHQVLRDRPDGYRRWRKMEELGTEIGADGVFIAEGAEWRRERKLAMYALNTAHLRQFVGRLEQVTDRLERRWRRAALTGNAIDVQQDLMRYTVDVTSGLAFGDDLNTLEAGGSAIQHHLDKLFPAVARRQTALFPYWRYFKLPADREVDTALAEVRKLISELIAKSRAKLSADPQLRERPTNFLEGLIAAQEKGEGSFSDEEISGNVMTLLLAGEDTTANTLAWIVHFMIEHPEIQAPLREEADRVLGTAAHPWRDYASAEKLPFAEAVAHEAMRCKPVAGHLFFEPLEDTQIEDVRVPKGTPVFVLTGHLGMQESNFARATEFRPQRWLEAGSASSTGHNSKAFLPFGAGPRYCPGHHLAMLEIKMVTAMLCRNFEVHPAPGAPAAGDVYAFTVMPTNVFACLRLRQPQPAASD